MLRVAAALAVSTLAAWSNDAAERDFFETRVRPVLAKNCFACHTTSKLGGLEMISREALVRGGNSGPAVAPGDPDHSLLIRAVRHAHERLKMPPEGGRLKDAEIDDLAAWVKSGVYWPVDKASEAKLPLISPERRAFWAFQPVQKREPPPVKKRAWVRSPIDSFILASLEAKGIEPAPAADRRAWIRRATYDLIGLPPTPVEVDAFLSDRSTGAHAKVVDRLLASPHYGERWGRHWLDVARYSDDRLNSTMEEPRPNAWRYRDWVIRALNDDLPYDTFVKAQIAGDLMGKPELEPAIGLYALSPEFQDDRVDVTTRGFMALTAACAQCHDHKYDPIPAADYYSLLGVFNSTEYHEKPLAAEAEVEAYKTAKKRLDDQQAAIKEFVERQANDLAAIFAARAADYLMASRAPDKSAPLDRETVDALVKHLAKTPREHPFLKDWDEAVRRDATETELRRIAAAFEEKLLAVAREKKSVDDKNKITLGLNPERRDLANANLLSLPRDDYFLWRDFFSNRGVFYHGEKKIDRFLAGEWKSHFESMRARLAEHEKAVPPIYPFLHLIRDKAKTEDERIHIRGDRANKGDVAPRRFLAILSAGDPARFTRGSGRLELAEAIADPRNPLTARVIVNRIWKWRFGDGLVRTASNFGQLGERPSHPELLDYLAARLVEKNWSLKALHREIVLSATYAMSSAYSKTAYEQDPQNRLLWRFSNRRLDAEAVRDSVLAVSGLLDRTVGGQAAPLGDDNIRRSVYGYVSRKKLEPVLALFDFPNPNATSEGRIPTDVPLQRLFLLNSRLMERAAESLAQRTAHETDSSKRIESAYKLALNRLPTPAETQLGIEFLKNGTASQYVQALMSSDEFLNP